MLCGKRPLILASFVVLLGSIPALHSVSAEIPKPAVQATLATGSITPGFDAPIEGATIATKGRNLPWYVALKVSATPASSPGGSSAVLTGSRAHSAWKQVLKALGIGDGVDKYTFVFDASIAGVTVPQLTAIQLTRTKTGSFFSSGSEEVQVAVDGGVYSPWVPIDAGSKISISAEHIGSAAPNFAPLQDAVKFSGKLTTAGGLAVSVPAQAFLNLAADSLQNALTTLGTYKTDSNWSVELFPFGGAPSSFSFIMRDVDGVPIARITVQLVFRRTLREPPETADTDQYPNMAGQLLESPAFMTLDTTGAAQKLVDQLAANAALATPLTALAGDVSAFNTACGGLVTYLMNAGLNPIDTTFFAVNYVQKAVNNRSDLRAGFWTNCLTGRQNIAKHIGIEGLIPLPPPPELPKVVVVSPTNVKLIGDYIVRRGLDRPGTADQTSDQQVSAMLASSLNWEGEDDALDQRKALAKLATLSADSYHCTFRVPVIDPGTQRNGVTIFLRNAPNPDSVLALYGSKTADEDAPISLVQYRRPTDAELKACTAYENRRNGMIPVAAAQ